MMQFTKNNALACTCRGVEWMLTLIYNNFKPKKLYLKSDYHCSNFEEARNFNFGSKLL